MNISRSKKGFTLIEILLVVAAIAILAGIVIVAINPAAQLSKTRDAERQSEVNAILNAVSQYILNEATVPAAIPTATCTPGTAAQEVCKAAATGTCSTGVALSTLLVDDYIAALPADPSASTDGTGYYITKTANGRVTVCATAETAGTTISVTR
jgi:prepilin-type N-terminal cleavage/methylation domain-containing protein